MFRGACVNCAFDILHDRFSNSTAASVARPVFPGRRRSLRRQGSPSSDTPMVDIAFGMGINQLLDLPDTHNFGGIRSVSVRASRSSSQENLRGCGMRFNRGNPVVNGFHRREMNRPSAKERPV